MSGIPFSFTRSPSVKVGVATQQSGLVAAQNTLVLIGHMAASGSTATANAPYTFNAYGDPVAAAAECVTQFGASSEVGAMVVAAINAVLGSDQTPKVYPPIIVIPIAHGDTSANLAATLAANSQMSMPYVAMPYASSDSVATAALKTFLDAISGDAGGPNAQFGSFGFSATLEGTSAVVAEAVALADQTMMVISLRDSSSTPSQPVWVIAAAVAALAAANAYPFLPMTDIVVGGLIVPALTSDYATEGDSGTEALLLAGGAVCLLSKNGQVKISRMVTTKRVIPGEPDTSYFDMQDFQSLYYLRQVAFVLASQPRYRIAKLTQQKLDSLKSEFLADLKAVEPDGLVENVDALTSQITSQLGIPGNDNAGILQFPVDIVPGFYNKGIGITGVQV